MMTPRVSMLTMVQVVKHKVTKGVVAHHARIGHAETQLRRAHGKDRAGAAYSQRGLVHNFFKLAEDGARVMPQDQVNIDFTDGQNVK